MKKNKKLAVIVCETNTPRNFKDEDLSKLHHKSIVHYWSSCSTRARKDGYNVVSCWGNSTENKIDLKKDFGADGQCYCGENEDPKKVDAIYVNDVFRAVRNDDEFKDLEEHFKKFGIKIVVCEKELNEQGYIYGGIVRSFVVAMNDELNEESYQQLITFLAYELSELKDNLDEDKEKRG